MTRFLPYNPDQAYLLPPNVKDVLGQDHLVFFVHGVGERLNLEEFAQAYGEEGGAVYAPELMLKVWLYAYALGVTSAGRLEQRIREDLAFRYLAGGATPDNWSLSAFRRRHARGINDVFRQVLERAQKLGMIRLGHVAIDSTRVRGAGSRHRVETETKLRRERARLRRQIRQWRKAAKPRIRTRMRGCRCRCRNWSGVWKRFPEGCNDCARAACGRFPAAIRRADFCAAGKAGNWATRPRLRSAKII